MTSSFANLYPVAARVTLKAVNDELARLGLKGRLEKGSGYFYFLGGDAAEWLDRTVQVATIGSLALPEWIAEFRRLKKLNEEIMTRAKAKR